MATWKKEDNTDKAIKLLLFLASPFFALLYSLRSIKTKSSYWVFFMFFLCFGLAFTVQSGKSMENSIDGASYREKFEYYKYTTGNQFLNKFEDYLSFKEGTKDYYFDSVAFVVSRFTDNYHVLFAVFAIVFSFFSLKSLKFLTSENNFTVSLSCFILVYIFMINQIFNINGVRFWTAAWIGVYCIFKIFRNGDKKYFILALLTPFFHAAFWIYIAVITFAYLSRKNLKLWIVLFFISFITSNISIEFVRGIIDSLPPFLSRMADVYTDEQYVNERNTGGTFIPQMFQFFVRGYINFLVFLFIKNAETITSNPKTSKLFPLLLIWMTFVNFTMPIPSLGGRFVILSYPVIAYIWLVNFKGRKYDTVLYIMPVVFLHSFYLQLLLYMVVLEPIFYFSNPFYLIYLYL